MSNTAFKSLDGEKKRKTKKKEIRNGSKSNESSEIDGSEKEQARKIKSIQGRSEVRSNDIEKRKSFANMKQERKFKFLKMHC